MSLTRRSNDRNRRYVPRNVSYGEFKDLTTTEIREKVFELTEEINIKEEKVRNKDRELEQEKLILANAKEIVNTLPGKMERKEKEIDEMLIVQQQKRGKIEQLMRKLYEDKQNEENNRNMMAIPVGQGNFFEVKRGANEIFEELTSFLEREGLLGGIR